MCRVIVNILVIHSYPMFSSGICLIYHPKWSRSHCCGLSPSWSSLASPPHIISFSCLSILLTWPPSVLSLLPFLPLMCPLSFLSSHISSSCSLSFLPLPDLSPLSTLFLSSPYSILTCPLSAHRCCRIVSGS